MYYLNVPASLAVVYSPGATFVAPGFVLYIFTNVGTYSFVLPTGRNFTFDVLIVAGGGGGGNSIGGYGEVHQGFIILLGAIRIFSRRRRRRRRTAQF